MFPAINVEASGTRKEELPHAPRGAGAGVAPAPGAPRPGPGAALELLIDKIRATKSNEQFLKDIAKAPAGN